MTDDLAARLATTLDRAEAEARACSPGPWFNGYGAIVSKPMMKPYDKWFESIDKAHTLERRGGCPACGTPWCDLHAEDYRRDPEVASVPKQTDAPTGAHAHDEEHIATWNPTAVLRLIERDRGLLADYASACDLLGAAVRDGESRTAKDLRAGRVVALCGEVERAATFWEAPDGT